MSEATAGGSSGAGGGTDLGTGAAGSAPSPAPTGGGGGGGPAPAGRGGSGRPAPGAGEKSAAPVARWRGSLPAEIQAEKSFDVFKGDTWEEVGPVMARTYLEGQKRLGSPKMPAKDAPKEEWDKFYQNYGRPEKPEDYKYRTPDLFDLTGEDALWNQERLKGFLKVAHDRGLRNEDVQALLDWYGGDMRQMVQTTREALNKTVTDLKNRWGGSYDRNIVLSQRLVDHIAAEEFAGEEEQFKAWLNGPSYKVGNDPYMVRLMAFVGGFFADDGFIDSGTSGGQETASDIQTKMDAMMADKSWQAGDKRKMEEWNRLAAKLAAANKKG